MTRFVTRFVSYLFYVRVPFECQVAPSTRLSLYPCVPFPINSTTLGHDTPPSFPVRSSRLEYTVSPSVLDQTTYCSETDLDPRDPSCDDTSPTLSSVSVSGLPKLFDGRHRAVTS